MESSKGWLRGNVFSDAFLIELNNLGSEGWELINIITFAVGAGSTDGATAIFKRKITE